MKKTKAIIQVAKVILGLVLMTGFAKGQTKGSTSLSIWDGMFVAGYVGSGAYINCGGPAVKWTMKPFSLSLGLFPAVRIKEDHQPVGVKKNAAVTPSTGIGLTSSYKHFVLQVPLFYDAKTAAANGKWNLGVGVGYKF